MLLFIYIASLYLRKISTFYSVERQNSGPEKSQLLCMRRRQDDVGGL